MYRKNKISQGTQSFNKHVYEGHTIEHDIRMMINNKEPITGTAEIVYTERKDGVLPQYNIRTDKMEMFAEGMDKVSELHGMQREARHGERNYHKMTEAEQKAFNTKYPNNKHALAEKQGGDL